MKSTQRLGRAQHVLQAERVLHVAVARRVVEQQGHEEARLVHGAAQEALVVADGHVQLLVLHELEQVACVVEAGLGGGVGD